MTGISNKQKYNIGNNIRGQCRLYQWKDAPYTERSMRIAFYCHKKEIMVLSRKSGIATVQQSIGSFFYSRINQLRSGYLRAFLTADTSHLPHFYVQRFRKMGVAHLFSASGLHLGLIFAFFFFPFRWLKFEKAGYWSGYIASFLFLLVLGFRVSLLRAFLFLTFFLLLKLLNRKTPPWFILTASAMALEVIFSLSSFSVSFILSFGVTGTILFLFPVIRKILTGYPAWLRDHLSVTFSAFAGSMILSSIFFGYFHVFQFFWNLIMVPLGSLYLFSGIIALIFPVIENINIWIDALFNFLAQTSFLFFEKRFDIPHIEINAAVIIFFWIFLLWAVREIYARRVWFLRANFLRIMAAFFIIYSIAGFLMNYIPSKKPQIEFYSYPYGISLLDEKSNRLILFGDKAGFIKDEIHLNRTFFSRDIYYSGVMQGEKKVHNFGLHTLWKNSIFEVYNRKPDAAQGDGQKSTSTAKEIPFDEDGYSLHRIRRGMFRYNKSLFLFEAHLDPFQWNSNELNNADHLFFILSRKKLQNYNPEEWNSFFMLFGFRGKIHPVGYFKWYLPAGKEYE